MGPSAVCLRVVLALVACLVAAGLPGSTRAQTGPRNIIVLIGDGMGPEQVAAAGMYQNGSAGTLAFEQLPYSGDMTTYSANSAITDSAASATAMATGSKVNNNVISMAYPGDGSELETSLEFFQDRCKSAGLVTSVYVTHATPAGWGAHEPSRSNYSQIAQDYLQQTRPNVIFGGGGNGLSESDARAAGYNVVTNRAEMQALDTEGETLVSGQFTTGALDYEWDYYSGWSTFFDTYPHLSEMTQTALNILDNDPDGFSLMVEGGLIDWAGHGNDLESNIFETLEFDKAFQVVWNWAQGRDDTLIIVTADHETGGLAILQNNGQGSFPTVSWSTGGHTAANVPVYAWGPNAGMVSGTIDNTDIYDISVANAGSPLCRPPRSGSVDVRVSQGTDDVEQRTTDGGMSPNSTDLELGDDPGDNGEQSVGLRFLEVTVSQGATVTEATIEFETDETGSEATLVSFEGQAADDATAFGSGTWDLTSRPTTAASVAWDIPPWNTVGEKHRSPDLSSIVQEIVDRGGWSAGNSMVFVISGTGERPARSYEGDSAGAPLLHIEYTEGGASAVERVLLPLLSHRWPGRGGVQVQPEKDGSP